MARLNHVKSFRGTSKTPDGNLTCGSCGDKIKPGDGYRWWANRLPGSRGSYRNIRCMKSTCTPRPSQMKPGRTGQIMAIGEGLDDLMRDYSTWGEDDFQSAADDLAGQIREIGEELEESADNIVEGFGHDTYQSDELRERAERIMSAADEMEQIDWPSIEDHPCEHCDGEGTVEQDDKPDHDFDADPEDETLCVVCGMDEDAHDAADDENCEECNATGHDEDAWREAMAEKLQEQWGDAEGDMY